MKRKLIAAAILATAFITPTFAEDKPAAESVKAVAPKAQANTPSKRHSHLDDRQGIKTANKAASETKPVDTSKHSHPKDR
jgi:hypothetical protein